MITLVTIFCVHDVTVAAVLAARNNEMKVYASKQEIINKIDEKINKNSRDGLISIRSLIESWVVIPFNEKGFKIKDKNENDCNKPND